MTTEWGVKHSQGIRHETSKKAAEQSLEWLMASYNKNFKNTSKPVIVSREVSEWAEYTEEEQS